MAAALSISSLSAQVPAPPPEAQPRDTGGITAAPPQPWRNYVFTVEVYVLDKSAAVEILHLGSDNPARYRRVIDLSQAGKARLERLTNLSMNNQDGMDATSEAVDEVRYPTSFSPSEEEIPISIPTAWETRNTGDMLLIGLAGKSEGDHATPFNIELQTVSLESFRDVTGMKGDNIVSQPYFNARRIRTHTLVSLGQPHFLGTLSQPDIQPAASRDGAAQVAFAFLHVHAPELLPKPNPAPVPSVRGPVDLSPALDIEYVCYSVERPIAREIVLAAESVEGPWTKLQPHIAARRAQLEQVASVNTRAESRTVNEAIHEFRAAFEYSAGERFGTSETTRRRSATGPESSPTTAAPNPAPKIISEETVTTRRTDDKLARGKGGPTAFDTRNVGLTIEVEPSAGVSPESIVVRQALANVARVGDLKTTGAAQNYPAQALFETRKIVSQQLFLVGKHQLVGTWNPPGANGVNGREDSGRTWLVFARATTSQAEK